MREEEILRSLNKNIRLGQKVLLYKYQSKSHVKKENWRLPFEENWKKSQKLNFHSPILRLGGAILLPLALFACSQQLEKINPCAAPGEASSQHRHALFQYY